MSLTQLFYLKPKFEIDIKWAYYSLLTQDINSMDNGSAIPSTSREDFYLLEAKLPPLSEQKAIAHVLGTLDDKIELNRRMNETLEGMAQAFFKSWFVDFDPVIDNALIAGHEIPEPLRERAETRRKAIDEGKANREVAKEFPDKFQLDEDLGWIPEGWEVDKLGSFLDVIETGRRPKGGVSKYTSGVPSIGAESINGIGNFKFAKTKYVPEEFFEKMKSGKIQDHDVLLYKDGGKPGEFKPRIGMLGKGFPFKHFGINEHVFRMRSNKIGQPLLYFQLGSKRAFEHLAVRGGKAAIPGLIKLKLKVLIF